MAAAGELVSDYVHGFGVQAACVSIDQLDIPFFTLDLFARETQATPGGGISSIHLLGATHHATDGFIRPFSKFGRNAVNSPITGRNAQTR